jgi:LDH2 family malate/lactate/ureidoglycolate dehydrogenase
MKMIRYEDLKDFVARLFIELGASEANAKLGAEVLLSADVRGVDSHGVARLAGYVRLKEAGRIDLSAKPVVAHETPSTATLDGQSGLGLMVAPEAMALAIKKAEQCGTGWVAVSNSSHFGIAGYHAMMALPHDMIGIAMTNASALVAPTFSKERLLGTNPIAMAIPAGEEPPFVADFATTTASNGKLELLQRCGEPTPSGWVQDAEATASNDPDILKKGGALLPLGSDKERSSHKGYMLGSMVDILSGILSGANYGPWVPPFPAYVPMPANMPGKGIGHFFGAMRIDAFRKAHEFKAEMDNWIRRFRNAEAIGEKQVVIPGDPERAMEKERRKFGIPIDNQLFEVMSQLADQYGVNFFQ